MTKEFTEHASLRDELEADLRTSEETNRDGPEAATLRLIMCAVRTHDAEHQAKGERKGCDDAFIRDVLELMVHQREETANTFEEAGRLESADAEREEIDVIAKYLPKKMDETALKDTISGLIDEMDGQGLKDLGRLMTELKSRHRDVVDCQKANKILRKALAS